MSSLNKAMLIGHLGGDPELRHTDSGTAVTNLSLATNDSWTDKQTGEKQERTEWHRIVAWGKLAELCANYLKKGRQVYIEGNIQTRKYTDNSGVEKYSTEIVARQVTFLGGRDAQPADTATSVPPPDDSDVPF